MERLEDFGKALIIVGCLLLWIAAIIEVASRL